MSWFVSDELVPVELEGCRCSGGPHDHDTVWLRPELDIDGALEGYLLMRAEGDRAGLIEKLGRLYVERGVVAWSFLDDEGQPVPVSRELIGKLNWDAVFPIANRAADLYSDALTRPLAARASKSLSNGHTVPSTSAKRRSSPSRQKR